jgi:hypothetical protein
MSAVAMLAKECLKANGWFSQIGKVFLYANRYSRGLMIGLAKLIRSFIHQRKLLTIDGRWSGWVVLKFNFQRKGIMAYSQVKIFGKVLYVSKGKLQSSIVNGAQINGPYCFKMPIDDGY